MDIALLTLRSGPLASFSTALEGAGLRVEGFGDRHGLMKALASAPWSLVILDGALGPLAPLVEELRQAHPSLPVAVIGTNTPESLPAPLFQALPSLPAEADAVRLVAQMQEAGLLDPALQSAQLRLEAMTRRHHANCVVCWDRHPFGLKVDYRVTGEHTVEGNFPCGPSYQGYTNVVHGGIVSSLLDGAMVSCTLAKGLEAYTVDLRVRYRSAVHTGIPATIRGEWIRHEGPLHLLQATLIQEGKVKATARAKFFEGTPDHPAQPLPGGTALRGLLAQARKRAI